MNNIQTVTVQIMGRAFSIQCPENKVKELEESAQFIDKKIHDLALDKFDKQVVQRENVLVITALNIAREFLNYQGNHNHKTDYLSSVKHNLRELKNKIEQELAA